MPRAAKRFADGRKRHEERLPCRKYHHLYCKTSWLELRLAFLKSNPLCVECKKEGISKLATVVDHVKPHRGDVSVFFDGMNLQALCKVHHDKKTYQETKHNGNDRN